MSSRKISEILTMAFIGDNFYLVGGGQIRIYDMANDYKEVGRLEL